jgi:hypothetical protein
MFNQEDPAIIFDVIGNFEISTNSFIYKTLNEYIDIEDWHLKYYPFFYEYLDDSGDVMVNIDSEPNRKMREAIKKANEVLAKVNVKLLFYYVYNVNFAKEYFWSFIEKIGTQLERIEENHYMNKYVIQSEDIVLLDYVYLEKFMKK